MSNILKLDTEKMETELTILNEAIDTFRVFAEKAFDDEAQLLDGMNSDFISKLKKILTNMQDDSAADLIKKLESYHDSAKGCKRQVLSSKKRKLFSSTFWQIKSSTFAYRPPRKIRGIFLTKWKFLV